MKMKEMKRDLYREGGGGGGGGVGERSWPINGLKCLLIGWIKKKGKLMVGIGNGGFALDGRSREMNSGPANFRRLRKFRKL